MATYTISFGTRTAPFVEGAEVKLVSTSMIHVTPPMGGTPQQFSVQLATLHGMDYYYTPDPYEGTNRAFFMFTGMKAVGIIANSLLSAENDVTTLANAGVWGADSGR